MGNFLPNLLKTQIVKVSEKIFDLRVREIKI
jgi:hypothetical protein